ncbi:MAG TPA: FliM/FliN family flagellar motor C-terminal domain-containing protein [Ramlibacter sp.]|nr:FliM/FliN family flagellar motor C-terminal domain-containing protein [Ramlibacter sp.]
MAYRPLRSWSASQLRGLEQAWTSRWLGWCADWGVPAPAHSAAVCTMAHASVADSGRWQEPSEVSPHAGLWWAPEVRTEGGDPRDTFLAALFAPDTGIDLPRQGPAPDLAREVARAAWHDFWQRVSSWCGTGGTTPADTPAGCLQPWSGAVLVSLPWPAGRLELLLAGAVAEAVVADAGTDATVSRRAGEALSPVWPAMAPLHCDVQVELQPVELTVGAVKGLRIGDVVELDHHLEAPLLARTEAGVLWEVFLGESGGHRAVELVRAPAPLH